MDRSLSRRRARGRGGEGIGGGENATLAVEVKSVEVPEIRFVRDVVPVMSKVGCNAGTCHGSAKGKNGFKLSLRGELTRNSITGR